MTRKLTQGVVTAPQPEAVEAGALALKRGGNAVDAAIATALVQTAVDPQMCGIAGMGSMQVYMPAKSVHEFIDFHARCPAAVRPDMWASLMEGETRDGFGFILKGRVNDVGYGSIAVPGSYKAYHEALTRFGTLSWGDVVEPAIRYARDGVRIRPHMHYYWSLAADLGRVDNPDRMKFTPSGRRIYCDADGNLLKPGKTLKNPDMARALERLARHGPAAFYEGEMADAIEADMKAHGGLITKADMRDYRTRNLKPIWGTYRGHKVSTGQPPGGGVMLIQMLNILENFDLKALGHNTPEYIRVVAEAMKRSTIDKDAHVGDPEFVQVPVDRLTDKAYARQMADAIKRGEQAHVVRVQQEAADTTQVSVVDRDGNAVTMTHTLGAPSGVISDGLGFMWNGCMGVFDPRPGRAGSLAPGKSRFSSMSPTIVFKGDDPHIVIGAPGGTNIVMGVLQAIINVVDHGMTMLEAIAAPRFSATSDTIDVVNRIPNFVCAELEAMGYPIAKSYLSYNFAGVHGIRIVDGVPDGAADPGRDGMALAV